VYFGNKTTANIQRHHTAQTIHMPLPALR